MRQEKRLKLRRMAWASSHPQTRSKGKKELGDHPLESRTYCSNRTSSLSIYATMKAGERNFLSVRWGSGRLDSQHVGPVYTPLTREQDMSGLTSLQIDLVDGNEDLLHAFFVGDPYLTWTVTNDGAVLLMGELCELPDFACGDFTAFKSVGDVDMGVRREWESDLQPYRRCREIGMYISTHGPGILESGDRDAWYTLRAFWAMRRKSSTAVIGYNSGNDMIAMLK
ncbi:hypothetical protein VTL71DRAFT_8592 [Oculimacula yallundae]|uniref:Uncharacterized protein n=1 Tax=Oculimacula yallundae TaxID=86028 RepID=A0ABR4CZK0_9HELO